MTNKLIFRDLPGIRELEAECARSDLGQLMADERLRLPEMLHAKSVELFGIGIIDTEWELLPPAHRPASRDDWEGHFEFLEWEYEEESAFWDAFGLDVSAENGEHLSCLSAFGRQMVCALKRLHPSAKPYFLGSERSPAQLEAEAQAWIARLLKPS